jgi:outer membrane receptor protein involved in Fe transport
MEFLAFRVLFFEAINRLVSPRRTLDMTRLLGILTLVLSCGASSFAQGVQTGTIRGTVKDQQGLALPGATITATSPALQGPRTAVTDSDGLFLFRAVPPGTYSLKVEMSGMAPLEKTANVPLGGVAQLDLSMTISQVQESVTVSGETPTMLTTPVVGINLKHDEVDALASRRDLEGIANLTPGATEGTAPNVLQLNINGAFAYDNLFMINGIDVNDNLFGSPQNVFIEDAIEETQVLTSGISAEYGRFSGGVINAITKSGGNTFTGSFRLNLANPTWSAITPFEQAHNTTRTSVLNKTYEATVGGPILVDRFWFFGAGRFAKATTSNSFPATGIKYDTDDDNKRGEIKLTATPFKNQTFQGNFTTNPRTQTQPAIGGFEIDPATLITRNTPNNVFGANWRGVLGSKLFGEAAYSQRHFAFLNAGGTSKVMADSPIFTLTQNGGAWEYNAPYFDSSDPEDRNNRQLTADLSYTLTKAGRHDLKGGWEWYRSQRTGGNSQSATSYVFVADFVPDAAGNPAFDANNRIIPVFVPGQSQVQHWIATRGAELNTDNNSFFLQDHWVATRRLSFDLGVRAEKVKSHSTGGIIGVDTTNVVPRLAAAFDPKGDGKTIFHVTYGWYSGRSNDTQVGANSAVGNPAETIGIYEGPAGQGRGFAAGFDPANYVTVFGSFPLANVAMAPGLSSPVTKEFTVSGGRELGGKGSAEVTYVMRHTDNFIEDFIDIANGTTDVVQNGTDFGTFTNIVFKNSNAPKRDYQGMVFQGTYRITPSWQVSGNYTLQLENDGTFNGEAQNQPGISSPYGDFPVAGLPSVFTRGYPDGHLYDFQRSKLRAWTIYTMNLHSAGRLSASGLVRTDSGLTYSLVATGVPLSGIQNNLLNAAGYPDAPSSQNVYFGGRGSQVFPGVTLFDTSFNYELPIYRTARPWVKFDVYNLFNDLKVIRYNTTVRPDPNSPLDAMGLPTGFIKGSQFGNATSTAAYPVPFQGQRGGRTFRVAFGFRF